MRNIPPFPFPGRLWLRAVNIRGLAAREPGSDPDFGRWSVEPGDFSVLVYCEGFSG